MSSASPSLTWREGEILRDGEPHRILSGAVHYFRIHPDQWEDRLRRLAAMGANTVDTYIPWNFHERVEGDIDFTGWRDVARFIRLAGEVGLDVYVRPSPYICAEWSNGGIPFWLSARTSALRTSDPVFTEAVDRWFDALIPQLAPLQAAHGGPIRLIQVENEYGSFGSDAAYLAHQRDALVSRGMVELLTTADGTMADMVRNGSIPGVMGTFTFGTGVQEAVALRRDDHHLMCSELWGGWFDHWGERHHVRSADSMISTVRELLDAGGSVSIYMAHGGTNFGLWAGANHDGRHIQPTITSYDSDAPIGEDGSLNDKFAALREAFAPFHAAELPPVPDAPEHQSAASAPLVPVSSLLDVVRAQRVAATSAQPLTFERLGAEDGLVAYEAELSFPPASTLSILGLRDRAVLYIGDERVGVMEHDGEHTVSLPAQGGVGRLTIVVESLGRINYGPLTGEHKGILRGVVLNGRRYVHGWQHRVLPLDAPLDGAGGAGAAAGQEGLAVASLTVSRPADAWLALPGSAKSLVWLNGFLLGRLWERGPQVTLYAPGPLWREGENEIVVLDTDRLGATIEIREAAEYGQVEEFIGS
ncbi:glycoside hydrolase family 35 protein [Microbacterium esteraromaticum]|uniref:glycoside hydrolase family 35 protein n=1 Tax=Microbacterium esteraromaticum TaxID=57043 RepID=UPI00195674E8|nr:beta-galactosidase family protein [Microbacterium esteraromaticum]MBM7466326.1 beta-galactosidase [Microbacterium esteraromaticum]